MSTPFAQELGPVLKQLLDHTNDTRKQAEDRFKVLAKDPAVIPSLLEYLHAHPEVHVRQIAAVLLRKRVVVHWSKLSAEVQATAKRVLLEKIVGEPEAIVRRAAADVVGVIAKFAVPAGQWPELLGFLMQCTQSQQPEHREVAMVMFCSLAETLPEAMHTHYATLHGIFLAGLQDAAPKVRQASMRAVQSLVTLAENDEDYQKVVALVGPVLAVCSASLQAGEEDLVLKAFEMFFDLVELPSRIVGPVVPAVVEFCLQVAGKEDAEHGLRAQGMELISQLAQSKPKQLIKAKLVQPLVRSLCVMTAAPSTNDEETDPDDDFELSMHKIAAQTLDMVAQFVPPQHVLPSVLEFCGQALPSADANHRRAGATVLSVLAEGCAEPMRKQLGMLVAPVVALLADPNTEVRGMAAFAISQFATHLQPDILEHHAAVLPGLFNCLRDAPLSVKERGMLAVEAFCEELGDEVVPYMGPLMQALLALFRENSKVEVQEMALSASCSIAQAAGEAFTPYLQELVPVIQQCMSQTAADGLQIRAHATECLGILISTDSGAANLKAHIPSFMPVALAGFQLDSSEVREYTHGFFSNTATALKSDFAEYLPHVVPLAFSSLQLDDGLMGGAESDEDEEETAAGKAAGIAGMVQAAVGDSDADSDDDGEQNMRIRTGVLDEKASACHALGAYMEATGELYVPYLEASLPLLLKMARHFHEDIRNPATISIAKLTVVAARVAPAGPDGAPAPAVRTILASVMPMLIETVDTDDDHHVVSSALCGAAEILKAVGAAGMAEYLPKLLEKAKEVIAGDVMVLQGVDSDDDEDDDEEESASGSRALMVEVLLEGVTELVPGLCAVGGAAFVPTFQALIPPLLKLGGKGASDHQHSLVSAVLVDSFKELGEACGPALPAALPFLLAELKSDDAMCRRNAAFAVGTACEVGGAHAAPFYATALQLLHPIVTRAEEDAGTKDNGVGALARMLAASAAPLPVGECLTALLAALPLREDMDEAAAVYGCLCLLLERKDAAVLPHAGAILKAFATAVLFDKAGGEANVARMSATLKALTQQFAAQFQQLLVGLAPDEQAAINQLVQA